MTLEQILLDEGSVLRVISKFDADLYVFEDSAKSKTEWNEILKNFFEWKYYSIVLVQLSII